MLFSLSFYFDGLTYVHQEPVPHNLLFGLSPGDCLGGPGHARVQVSRRLGAGRHVAVSRDIDPRAGLLTGPIQRDTEEEGDLSGVRHWSIGTSGFQMGILDMLNSTILLVQEDAFDSPSNRLEDLLTPVQGKSEQQICQLLVLHTDKIRCNNFGRMHKVDYAQKTHLLVL